MGQQCVLNYPQKRNRKRKGLVNVHPDALDLIPKENAFKLKLTSRAVILQRLGKV